MGPAANREPLLIPRFIAIAAGMGLLTGWSVGLPCAVVVRPDPPSEFIAVANRFHDTVVEVRRPVTGFPSLLMPSGAAVIVAPDLAITTMQALGSAPQGSAPQTVVLAGAALPVQSAQVVGTLPAYGLAIVRLSHPASIDLPAEMSAPASGENLIVLGSGDDAVDVMGVTVIGVRGDLFGLVSNRMIDSRFWGGPLLDVQGRLVGICLPSIPEPVAVTAATLRLFLSQFTAAR